MKSLTLSKNIIEANFRRSRFPYKLTFVATYRCQSRCVYCKIWEREPVGELTLEEISGLLQEVQQVLVDRSYRRRGHARNDIRDREVDHLQLQGFYHLHTSTASPCAH
jgi:hypothetical protein